MYKPIIDECDYDELAVESQMHYLYCPYCRVFYYHDHGRKKCLKCGHIF